MAPGAVRQDTPRARFISGAALQLDQPGRGDAKEVRRQLRQVHPARAERGPLKDARAEQCLEVRLSDPLLSREDPEALDVRLGRLLVQLELQVPEAPVAVVDATTTDDVEATGVEGAVRDEEREGETACVTVQAALDNPRGHACPPDTLAINLTD